MNRRSILAAYKKKSSHLQTGVTGFKSGNLFKIVRKYHATAAPHTTPVAARNAPVWARSQSVGIDARPAIYRPKFPAFGAFFPRKAFPAQALPGRVSPVQEKPALINTK